MNADDLKFELEDDGVYVRNQSGACLAKDNSATSYLLYALLSQLRKDKPAEVVEKTLPTVNEEAEDFTFNHDGRLLLLGAQWYRRCQILNSPITYKPIPPCVVKYTQPLRKGQELVLDIWGDGNFEKIFITTYTVTTPLEREISNSWLSKTRSDKRLHRVWLTLEQDTNSIGGILKGIASDEITPSEICLMLITDRDGDVIDEVRVKINNIFGFRKEHGPYIFP